MSTPEIPIERIVAPPVSDGSARSGSAAAVAPAAPPTPLPSRFEERRTWELELLISGAVVFTLLQLPGGMDSWVTSVEPHLTRQTWTVVFLGSVYVKAILYVLIAAFLMHIAGRAYWVGLIGLEAVYPDGIRWNELTYGPNAKRVYRRRTTPISEMIERTDRFCSVIFSITFLIVGAFVVSTIGAGATGALAYGISRNFLGGEYAIHVFYGLTGAVGGPMLVAAAIDRLYGERLDPDGRAARVIRGIIGTYQTIFLVRVYATTMMTLASNMRQRVFSVVLNLIFVGVLVVAIADGMVDRGVLRMNGYQYVPDSVGEAGGVDYRHYENQLRTGEVHARVPTIQSDIVNGPYVRLFIPYSPARHNAAVAARCPDTPPLQPLGLRVGRGDDAAPASHAASAVACMAAIHEVRLNGAVMENAGFRFYRHPKTGLLGIVAYLPTGALPRGANEITVKPAPRERDLKPGAERDEDYEPMEPYTIPFWL